MPATLGLLLCSLVTCRTAPRREPVAPPPFALTRLGLDLAVLYDRGTIAGSATLTLRNTSAAPAVTVPLLLGRLMHVARVDGAGGRVAFDQQVRVFEDDSTRQVSAIIVRLPRAVAPGDSTAITVRYAGTLVGYPETGSLYIRDRVAREFTILRADAYAFPTVGVLSARANRAAPVPPFAFSARITVPLEEVVAMGGERVGRTTAGDSLATWHYRSREPVPFLNVTIAPYRVVERDGVRVYHLPADSAGARMVSAAAGDALSRFAAWYGPLEREPALTVMEIPEGFGSQASLSAGIIQTADAFRDRGQLRQLYHELSHLWNAPDLERPSPRWNEGLASFLQWRMAAELDGWNDWDGQVTRTAQTLARRCAAPTTCDRVPMREYGTSGLTDRAYQVGMLMFYALYRVLGPEAFDRAYRAYYQARRRGGGSTAQLATAFTAVDARSARIFADWLDTTRWHTRLTAGETMAQLIEGYAGH